MTLDEIKALREMEAKATEGPWEASGNVWGSGGLITNTENRQLFLVNERHAGIGREERIANGQLAAAARNALPALIDLAEEAVRLRERVKELEATLTGTPAKPTAKDGYFILCRRHRSCGGSPLWWGPNGSGYVDDLTIAGVYSETEALNIVNGCHGEDKMIPCEKAYEVAIWYRTKVGRWNTPSDADRSLDTTGNMKRASLNKVREAAENAKVSK